MNTKVKTALIASGGGTDANSIMAAYRGGCLKYAEVVLLVSTKEGAGCLEKAANHQVPTTTLDFSGKGSLARFNAALKDELLKRDVKLVFLVGCIRMVEAITGIQIYNIHPAHPVKHGGKGMYGLEPHIHVLKEILDQIKRQVRSVNDVFLTHPTVHLATPGVYDLGAALLPASIPIPQGIIQEMADLGGTLTLEDAAQQLQQHVLAYEHLMLPAAVDIAGKMILDKVSLPL